MYMMGISYVYPPVNIQKAIEHGPVEIVDFPINSMVIFHSYVKISYMYNPPKLLMRFFHAQPGKRGLFNSFTFGKTS